MIFDQMTQHQAINLAKPDSETKNMTEGNVDDGEGEKHRKRTVKVFLTRLRSRSVDQLLGVPSIRRVDPRSVLGETRYIYKGGFRYKGFALGTSLKIRSQAFVEVGDSTQRLPGTGRFRTFSQAWGP